MPQKPTQWPCIRNPPSGHASALKTIQWSIQQSNIFQWPYFVHCLSSKHSAAKYLNMVFFILVKNCFYQMFGLVKPVWRMMTAPHFWDNVSPKFWFYKKHKSNCYILKIKWKWNVLYTGMKSCRPFCSSCVDKVIQFERCVQCLGNVVVWWCAGNIALYRWESWLDVWGNVARSADCRPVPTATPAMRACWLRTRSSLAWLMASCLLYPSSS